MSASETSKLLPTSAPEAAVDCAAIEPPPTLWRASKDILRYAAPVSGAQLLGATGRPVILAFIGRLGPEHIAGASIALAAINPRGFTMPMGLSAGLDTLMSQIHGRNPADTQYGLVAQRMLLILWVACVPFAALFYWANDVFAALGYAPAIVEHGGLFLRIFAAAYPFISVIEVARRYVQNTGVTRPLLAIQAGAALLTPFLVWLFMDAAGMGYAGAPTGYVVQVVLMALVMVLFVVFFLPGFAQTWPGVSRDALRGWGPVLRQAFPAWLLGAVSVGPIQVINFIGGYLSVVDLAAFSIAAQLYGMVYMMTFGLAFGVSYFVGTNIGRGNGLAARRYAVAGALTMLPVTLLNAAVLLIFRRELAALFTDDKAVIESAAVCAFGAAVLHVCDAQQVNAEFALKGLGKQHHGVAVVSLAWIVVGLPLSYALTFHAGWGASGLFAGLAIASLLIALPLFFVLLRSYDWEHIEAVSGTAPPAPPADDAGAEGLLSGDDQELTEQSEL
jgi:MATE family multidrug resistance protein